MARFTLSTEHTPLTAHAPIYTAFLAAPAIAALTFLWVWRDSPILVAVLGLGVTLVLAWADFPIAALTVLLWGSMGIGLLALSDRSVPITLFPYPNAAGLFLACPNLWVHIYLLDTFVMGAAVGVTVGAAFWWLEWQVITIGFVLCQMLLGFFGIFILNWIRRPVRTVPEAPWPEGVLRQAPRPLVTPPCLPAPRTGATDFVREQVINLAVGHFDNTRWGQLQMMKVAAHEPYHIYQAKLSGLDFASPVNKVPGTGPHWLPEGSARFSEYRALLRAGILPCDMERNSGIPGWIARQGKYEGKPLRPMETRNGLDEAGSSYNFALLAAEALASLAGERALMRYYALQAETTWRRAFEFAFGITVEKFYDPFEDYRASGFPQVEIPGTNGSTD